MTSARTCLVRARVFFSGKATGQQLNEHLGQRRGRVVALGSEKDRDMLLNDISYHPYPLNRGFQGEWVTNVSYNYFGAPHGGNIL